MVPESTTRNRKLRNEKYEGLAVNVERSVDTIAAGSIGNNKAIESVYERRNDPRNGEWLYRVMDIKRTDPDANVFKVPSGYTVGEGKK